MSLMLLNLNHVACFAYHGSPENGDWVLEFCHNFKDGVEAKGWVDLQLEEFVIMNPRTRINPHWSDAQAISYIYSGAALRYKFVQCNVYAAIQFCDRTDIDITPPIPLWKLVIYRTGVPDFQPEEEHTYAASKEEAEIKTLQRLGDGWEVYGVEQVDWADCP